MTNQTTILAITAILCITILMTFAIFQGINGKLLATALTIIGGLGGYHLKDTISSRIHPPSKTKKTETPPQP